MRIVLSPDPLLRQVCEPVEIGDASMKRIAKHMLKEMYHANGVGLAAPQVAILKRMVVIDCDYVEEDEDGEPLKKKPLVMINPEIIEHADERVVCKEGCLSVPGITVEIERWAWVKVKCYDENYNEVIHEGDGLFGDCMQHELDHLDGITLFERLDPAYRMKAIEAYQQAQSQGAKPDDC